MHTTPIHQTAEFAFTSSKEHEGPFNEIELDAVFSGNDLTCKVPAFWAGGGTWKVRFAATRPGTYGFRTVCSDSTDSGLHDQEGVDWNRASDTRPPSSISFRARSI